jgi:N6-L-threonylcarbamoyladenine synthase
VIDSLIDRTRLAMRLFRADFPKQGEWRLVVAGGVAANQAIGGALDALAAEEGFTAFRPPPGLCTDNAAMIAWAGVERLSLQTLSSEADPLSVSPRARWPLAAGRWPG